MKLTLSLFAGVISSVSALNSNTLGCLNPNDVDENTDYFPHKVEPEFSTKWDISYHKTYKILKNLHTNASWLLYQCGTTIPESEEGKHQGSFRVPLQDGLVLSSTTHLTHIEQLGLRRQLKGMVGGTAWIGSPCFRTLADEGLIENIDTTGGISMEEFLADHPEAAVIKGSGGGANTIHFSGTEETESKDLYEWHKVFGALFNLEKTATKQFDESTFRFDCAADNADYLASKRRRTTDLEFENAMKTPIRKEIVNSRRLNEKPKVLWASHTLYGGPNYNETSWDIGDCSKKNNYYCEFAEMCDSTILHSNDGSIPVGATDDRHMNFEEFIEFAKDADIWIYSGFNFDATFRDATFNEELKKLKSVQNNQVYDVQKTSGTWFEHRIAEYDIVLQDFCEVTGRNDDVAIPHERMYFRKVLPIDDPEPIGSLGVCPNGAVDLPWETRASDCIYLRPNSGETEEDESSSSATRKFSAITVAIATLALTMA